MLPVLPWWDSAAQAGEPHPAVKGVKLETVSKVQGLDASPLYQLCRRGLLLPLGSLELNQFLGAALISAESCRAVDFPSCKSTHCSNSKVHRLSTRRLLLYRLLAMLFGPTRESTAECGTGQRCKWGSREPVFKSAVLKCPGCLHVECFLRIFTSLVTSLFPFPRCQMNLQSPIYSAFTVPSNSAFHPRFPHSNLFLNLPCGPKLSNNSVKGRGHFIQAFAFSYLNARQSR